MHHRCRGFAVAAAAAIAVVAPRATVYGTLYNSLKNAKRNNDTTTRPTNATRHIRPKENNPLQREIMQWRDDTSCCFRENVDIRRRGAGSARDIF